MNRYILDKLREAGYSQQFNEALRAFLRDEGYTGQLNNALYRYLGSLGYTNTLSERMLAFMIDGGTFTTQTITGTAPVLAALTDGDTLSTAVTWGSYASSAGTIVDPTVKEMSVNGASYVAYNGATVVSADDTYQLRETVTDSAANERVFVSAVVAVEAAVEVLAITEAPGFSTQPRIGLPLDALPAVATGNPAPSISYTWYLGEASGGSVLAGVSGTTYDSPIATQLGQPIGIRATASNGVDADVTADGLSGPVSVIYEDDWSQYTIGDTDDVLLAGVWAGTGSGANNLNLVANAGSATGRGMEMEITANTPTAIYRADINTTLANAPSGMMMESVYVVDVNDPGSRFMLKNGTGYSGGAGVSCRIGAWYHQLPGDDATVAEGVALGNFDNKTIVIRHRIEGAVSSVWIWDIETAEPSTPTSVRTYEVATVVTDIPLHAPAIGMGQTGAGAASQVLYMSCGLATSAPISDVFPVISATGADALEFIAATERGATYDLVMNNQITVSLEDLA